MGNGKAVCYFSELRGLRLFPRRSAVEFAGEEFDDARGHLDGGFRVEKQSASAAGEDVIQGARHFMPSSPDDLSACDGQGLMKALAELGLLVDEVLDPDGIGPID